MIKATFIPINVVGRENLPSYPNSPSIFVVNHSSGLDIPIVEDIVGTYPHIWMCKNEYGKIPLFGALLRRMHVLIDRFSSIKAARALSTIYNLAKDRATHIVMFPEGTRSVDGKLQPFLGGFAMLSKKLNRPIIPIAIKGAYKVIPKGSYILEPVPIEVIIGKPITDADEGAILAWFERIDSLS